MKKTLNLTLLLLVGAPSSTGPAEARSAPCFRRPVSAAYRLGLAAEADERENLKQIEYNTRVVRSMLARAEDFAGAKVSRKPDGTLDISVATERGTYFVHSMRVILDNGERCLVQPAQPYALDQPLPEFEVDCRVPTS